VRRNTLGILGLSAAIAACAGGAQNIIGPELFTYTAASEVTSTNPMRFRTSITITNPTTDNIQIVGQPCNSPRVLVYATAARTGTPLWDSNSRPTVCTLPGASMTLAAGKSVTYTANVTGAEVLGASGSPGTYYITDQVSLSGVVSQATAGQVNLTR
jgi:hypothetical protein